MTERQQCSHQRGYHFSAHFCGLVGIDFRNGVMYHMLCTGGCKRNTFSSVETCCYYDPSGRNDGTVAVDQDFQAVGWMIGIDVDRINFHCAVCLEGGIGAAVD